MKFIVATYGTDGDTRPLAALCRGTEYVHGHPAGTLSVDPTVYVLNSMVNDLVSKLSIESRVAEHCAGVECCSSGDVLLDEGLNSLALPILNRLGTNLATAF